MARWHGEVPCHPYPLAGAVYIEVPKAASTSIKQAMARFKMGELEPGEDVHRWTGYTEARDVEQLQRWLCGRWARAFRFTVVRHPVDRFVSFFYGHGLGDDLNRYVLEEFMRDEWSRDIHCVPQTELLGEALDAFDYVGHAENMTEVQVRLSEELGVPIVVPHANRYQGEREELTKAARRRLRFVYRRDLKVLGYR